MYSSPVFTVCLRSTGGMNWRLLSTNHVVLGCFIVDTYNTSCNVGNYKYSNYNLYQTNLQTRKFSSTQRLY